jgi:hypothetical protein
MSQPRGKSQLPLFEEPLAVPVVRLPPHVREQLRLSLGQWMRTVAKTIREEGADEQDHR